MLVVLIDKFEVVRLRCVTVGFCIESYHVYHGSFHALRHRMHIFAAICA